VSWSCVFPHHWHPSYLLYFVWVDHVYPHIIDTYMTPVILTLLCELIMCIPTSLTPIWHPSYLLYFVSWSCVSPHHWHLSYLLYFVRWGSSWSWSYGSWILNYLYNQCLSLPMLWVRTPFMARCTRQLYVIKFVSDLRQVSGFLQVFRFPQPITLTATI
jgi:hypothetical protein